MICEMKAKLYTLIQQAVATCQTNGSLPAHVSTIGGIDRAKSEGHGDYASNAAMILAKLAKRAPREIAQQLIDALPADPWVEKVEIAGPGFINFFLSPDAFVDTLRHVLEQADTFGHYQQDEAKAIHLEFISANPTGPLHVGHGRGAAMGDSLGRLLKTAGFDVTCEYYVNDAGRQMNILAVSVWIRYLQQLDANVPFPSNAYKGDYVIDIAKDLKQQHKKDFLHTAAEVLQGLPADEPDGGDKEQYIDALIAKAQVLLGASGFAQVHRFGLDAILADIRDDLLEFGVQFDEWFSEKSLVTNGALETGLKTLDDAGYCYQKDGATWFNAIHFGDEKDRVLVRANGQTTYFASDVAYHFDKYRRGNDLIIDILGADHHGYVQRVKAAIEALGYDPQKFSAVLVQFAILYRGKERVQMSTRSGSFVTLRELREEVGNDAARFFYVMRKAEQHMDFDLELAKSKSNENPVYYIQYAHARICSIWRQLDEKQLTWDAAQGEASLQRLVQPQERALIAWLAHYPDMIQAAAKAFEPHQVAHYLLELAPLFHSYYNAHKFIVDDPQLRNARLCLIKAVQITLTNGLNIIGVSTPERM